MELRRRRDEDAQRALAEAARQVRAAESGLQREERRLADTLALAAVEEAALTDLSRAIWHRNWMRRQRLVIEAARRQLDERHAAERAAAADAMDARRKLRALERLRERMWQAFLAAERRAEQKDLDVLAGLRYVARHGSAPGGA